MQARGDGVAQAARLSSCCQRQLRCRRAACTTKCADHKNESHKTKRHTRSAVPSAAHRVCLQAKRDALVNQSDRRSTTLSSSGPPCRVSNGSSLPPKSKRVQPSPLKFVQTSCCRAPQPRDQSKSSPPGKSQPVGKVYPDEANKNYPAGAATIREEVCSEGLPRWSHAFRLQE